MSGLLFADDFVGLAEAGPALQCLIDIIYNYSNRWRFEANVKKCAVVIFSKTEKVTGTWVWGHEVIPTLDSYCYLGVEFSNNGLWDKHIKFLLIRNKQKLGSLYRILHNHALDLKSRKHILMSILRPSLEYASEVWNVNKCQNKALESIQLRACKYILGCSLTTCDEPVRGDLGLEALKSRRDFRRLKWYYKVLQQPEVRLPFRLLSTNWESIKCRGRPRRSWATAIETLKKELDLQARKVNAKEIRKAIEARELKEFELALQHKSKLHFYRDLKTEVGFEEYLKYVKGADARLFFKFRSGTHGLFEELGRHVGRGGSQECPNCGALKESVEHVLFECVSYDSQRQNFFEYLKQVLSSETFGAFFGSSIFDKALFCLGEMKGLLVNDECSSWYSRVGDFLMSVWNKRKELLYGSGLAHIVKRTNPTPECEANGTECYGS